MKKNAFTLIELLVVIAIIAVLASIAIPVYGAAQEKARATQDANNLRQLGIGITAYLNDHDDDFFAKASTGGSWAKQLRERYVPAWKAFHSPFDKRPQQETGTVPVSYGLNSKCFDINTSKFSAPSELIIAAPAVDPAPVVKFSGTSDKNVEVRADGGGAKKLGTHQSRNQINALFADTHVKSILYKDYATTAGEQGKRRWEPDSEKQQ